MRKSVIIAAAVVVVAAAAILLRNTPAPPPVPEPRSSTPKADGMTLVTNTDPPLVFQKAFWRRPEADDRILHAERHEWSTGEGVRKWQWFIAVEPGPRLLQWLKSDPFAMTKIADAGDFENRPVWFPEATRDFHIRRNTEGSFTIMLSADGKHLYATDSGKGFSSPQIKP